MLQQVWVKLIHQHMRRVVIVMLIPISLAAACQIPHSIIKEQLQQLVQLAIHNQIASLVHPAAAIAWTQGVQVRDLVHGHAWSGNTVVCC